MGFLRLADAARAFLTKGLPVRTRRSRPPQPPQSRDLDDWEIETQLPHLPSEVLAMIIEHLIPPAFTIDRRSPSSKALTPSLDVLHACLVDQSWYIAGRHLLYFRVVLHGLRRMKRFYELLRQKPRLRNFVHELVFLDEFGLVPSHTGENPEVRDEKGNLDEVKVRMNRLSLAIVSACPRPQRLSLHLYSVAKGKPFQIAKDYSVSVPPTLNQLLITGMKREHAILSFPSSNSLQVLTFFGVLIHIRTLGIMQKELHHLHSLNIIESSLFCVNYPEVIEPLRNFHSLRIFQLVNTDIRVSPTLEELQPVAQFSISLCPENVELFSLINVAVMLRICQSSPITWSSMINCPKTLRELRLDVSYHPLPPTKLPPTLTSLILSFQQMCNYASIYESTLINVRLLLEQNQALLDNPTFKMISLLMDPKAQLYRSVGSIMQEELQILALCTKHSVDVHVMNLQGMCPSPQGDPFSTKPTSFPSR